MQPKQSRNLTPFASIAAVTAAAVAPYVPSLGGGFVLDDKQLILANPIVHSLANIGKAFSTHFLYGYANTESLYYRPLVTLSYQLNYALSGENPFAYRLTNVLLNLVAALLVFAVARKMTGRVSVAGLAGVLFAVLPSHAESVAWISGRTDVLATVFGLGAFLLFIKSLEPEKFSWLRALSCSLLTACALFAKESALVLPALMALYMWVFRPQVRRPDFWKWCGVIAAPVVVYLAARHLVLGAVLGGSGTEAMLGPRMARLGYVYAEYLRMLVLPTDLRIYYGEPGKTAFGPAMALAWLVPLALLALLSARKKWPLVAFGAGWVLITLAPSADLIYTTTLLPAERFVYLASVGSSIVLAWLIVKAHELRPQSVRMLPAVVVILAVGYVLRSSAVTVSNATYYQSELAWARRIAETAPPHKVLRLTAAQAFLDANQPDAALAQYEAVVSLASEQMAPKERASLEFKLGTLYEQFGQPQKAERAFEKAFRDDPTLHKQVFPSANSD